MHDDAYFDLEIGRLPVGRPVVIQKDVDGSEHDGTGVSISGSPPLDHMRDENYQDGAPAYCLSVSDNGVNGDGVWLVIRPKEDHDEKYGVTFFLEDYQVVLLHAALEAVLAMRKAQAGGS